MAADNQNIQRGDVLRKQGHYAEAVAAYREGVVSPETPDPDVCVKIARCLSKLGDGAGACSWLCRVVDCSEQFAHWQAAAGALTQILQTFTPAVRRTARLALLGSYTTTQFVPLLRLAALREGVLLEIQESHYGQYRQDIIDPNSRLYAFEPDMVLFAVHAGEVALPGYSAQPQQEVEAELARWRSLWDALASRSAARIIMHNFAVPLENAFGHLSARVSGSRPTMLAQLNARLGEAASSEVSIVDCDRLAAMIGKRRWFDDRYWHLSKQAVSLDALPLLSRHTAAVAAAALGLGRKCLVLDLDNTLWGGVIGEDGLAGIRLGAGNPQGEAYVAFQSYIRDLKNKGVILAVCSKNNDADAREPFIKHPDMQLRLDDIAMFVANWERKPENLKRIAQTLNIGLDALVFVDDNPAEREVVRQFLPEVDVVNLPADPARYTRALSDYLMFETAWFTAEDASKTSQYKARAQIAELESAAASIEDFYRSLQMKAVVEPFDELHLPRIVQLIGKTNQFNLTTRRHSLATLRQFMADSGCVHLYLKLRDRFADHGLVSVLIAHRAGEIMDIDTWLMSCRVIGRTVEAELLAHLSAAATRMGCTTLRGTYISTAKNAMVRDIYARFGFHCTQRTDAGDVWTYDLVANGPIVNGFIEVTAEQESAIDAA